MSDPAADCPPDAENSTPDAPAPRAAPLQHTDKADAGCLIFLAFLFAGIFLLPAAMIFGGVYVALPSVLTFLLLLATPFFNPMERRSAKEKWWGRAVTFLVLAALVAAAWYAFTHWSGAPPQEEY
jgi:hypothetical protein